MRSDTSRIRPIEPVTDFSDLKSGLLQVLSESQISTTGADRDQHSHDESDHPPVLPDLVVWPEKTAQVSAVTRLANRAVVPITPWGAATSLEGHTIPVNGGIVMDLGRMDRVLDLRPDDFQADVQPGLLRLDLEERLGQQGLFFPPDPGANASIGGMIANNAAGIRALKYGATSANILGLEVVLADGTVVNTGSRSIKQSSGYDLTHLIVGSEGTLAIVTAATLRLAPIPEHFSTALAAFPDLGAAAQAVRAIIGYGLEPAALELIHQDHIEWMNEENGTDAPVAPSLMIEFTGSSQLAVAEAMLTAAELSTEAGAIRFDRSPDQEARSRLWRFRHDSRPRLRQRFPNQDWVSMDASVPISQFPVLIDFIERRCAELGLSARVGGHAGDGNIHMGLHHPKDDSAARVLCDNLGSEVVHKAIELGGTSTGEHGVGLGKRRYMLTEHGHSGVEMMQTIKRALDPNGILNPGKVLPS